MFYKPNFCCHCGDKIERVDWKATSSRRFCEVCETDFAAREWLPRLFAGLLLAFGLFGAGALWRAGGEKPLPIASRPALASRPESAPVDPAASVGRDSAKPAVAPERAAPERAAPATPADARRDATEKVFFCGAETKKGTACSRRVKGGGRCWQHQGLAAMLPADKLAAN